MRVFIYWNLHRACWSIKALQGPDKGRVVAHASAWRLNRAEFRVSEAGRQRVLREQRKNVHAGVVGVLEAWERDENLGAWAPSASDTLVPYVAGVAQALHVTYNPYKGPSFMAWDRGPYAHHRDVPERFRSPIHSAEVVVARGREVLAVPYRP